MAGLAASGIALALIASGGQVSDHIIVFGTFQLTITLAILALALFAAISLHRTAARSVGMLAALIVGAISLLVINHGQVTSGSPFALALVWLPLAATALLSALAAWRA
jgi:hypothetical protein